MRAHAIGALAVALALGAGAGRSAAQSWGNQGWQGKGPGLVGSWFVKPPESPKPPAEKPPALPEVQRDIRPTALDAAAEKQAREKALFDRRQAVADKIQRIALDTDDEALLRKAQQLNERAWALYQQRTMAPAAPAAPAAHYHSDEQTLSKHLGSPPPRGEAPTPPNLTLRTLQDNGSRTAARKE